MARLLTRRVAVTAAIAVAAAATAAGVAVAGSGSGGSPASPPGGSGSASTAPVVRTTLTSTVQVGGSIGYSGSYAITAPSGASSAQVAQAQQAVTAARQQLSGDEQAASDDAASGNQSVSVDQATVSGDQSALAADKAAEATACAGAGASSAVCTTAEQKVSADRSALTQARQQLAAAQAAAKTADDQATARVAADRLQLQDNQATLASFQADAVGPGTTYTWLPAAGQVIRQGQRVYAVSGVPVPLLYGSIPAWRPFYVGMSDGRDVGELTRDLIRMGYGPGLTQSDRYSAATAAAVERWQRAAGLPVTGEVLLGEVVFEPGPIRVTSVTTTPGTTVAGGGAGGAGGGGTVLTATGTTPVVSVDLPVTQEYLVKPGDAVSVVLPDGTTTVGGTVQSVGTVASCPGGSSSGSGGGSSAGSPCSSPGSGSSSTPTVMVAITLDSTPPEARLDQAPVNVNITTQRADNVLAVPVNALLALAGGGYGVDVVSGGTTHLVGVTTGLYSDTMVQVSGPGIAAGERVEVPAS